jgi:hypothetical protein
MTDDSVTAAGDDKVSLSAGVTSTGLISIVISDTHNFRQVDASPSLAREFAVQLLLLAKYLDPESPPPSAPEKTNER